MRVRFWYALPVLIGVFGFLAMRAVSGVSEESGPQATPVPIVEKPEDAKLGPGPENEGDFPLNEPIPTSIVMEIGGKSFQIPEGATAVLVGSGLPLIDQESGKVIIGGDSEHESYWRVARGESSLLIDEETGEVFDVDVKPEDVGDFAQIMEPAN